MSRYYRAPELIFASNYYNEKIDIWGKSTQHSTNIFSQFKFVLDFNLCLIIAVGCILFELITKTPLFPGDSEGLQILEQTCIIGSPTEEDFKKLSKIVEDKVLKIVR